MRWSEFIEKLAKLGVRLVKERVTNGGNPFLAEYFVRELDGRTLVHAVAIGSESELLLPRQVMAACENLQIDPSEFGMGMD